jgi:diguanylate cyclase (GGDEF)-like protein
VNEIKHSGAPREEEAHGLDLLAESELTRSGFRLSFTEPLETRYCRETATERVRELRFIVLWGVALYFCLGILLNLTIIPNPSWRDVAIQLVGSSLAALVMTQMWLRDGVTVAARENALLACCLACSVAAILVVAAKPTPATLHDFLLAIPPASFVLIFVRLRFRQAVVFFLTNLGVYALSLFLRPEISANDNVFLVGFMATLLFPAMIGAHAFERVSRRIYLHGLLDRLRNENLAEKNATLAGLSYTDPVTNIPNRRRLDEALSVFLNEPGSAGALLLADIDMFKAFNDRYGHLVGDACLRQVAQCLSSRLRRLDLLVRFGGEEFAVLLPEATMDEAAQTAERLREAVQALRFAVQGHEVNVTISIGIAARKGFDAPESLIGAADAALYAAKRAGRNRVHVGVPVT